MKRVSLFVIVLLFVMSMGVAAGGFEFVGGPTISKIDVDLNIKTELIEDERERYTLAAQESSVLGISLESEEGAAGYYGGMRYLFDNGFGLGAGYESKSFKSGLGLDVEYDGTSVLNGNLNLINSLSGPYIEGLYAINDIFALRGAISSNSLTSTLDAGINVDYYSIDESINEDLASGNGVEYQIGAEANYPITDEISILSSASYITGTVDIDKVYNGDELTDINDVISDTEISVNYSGIKFAIGVNYSF